MFLLQKWSNRTVKILLTLLQGSGLPVWSDLGSRTGVFESFAGVGVKLVSYHS